MNAGGGGGMMEDDIGNDRRDRDLLDWMYLLSRVVLLISIVYFYSSISRFLLVAFIGGLVYLYQNGAFGNRRRRERERERFIQERRERFRNPDLANNNNDNNDDEAEEAVNESPE